MSAFSPTIKPVPFSIARLPRIVFGEGRISQLPDLIAEFGQKVLLITGERSFPESPHWPVLCQALQVRGLSWETFKVGDEPSPERVDEAVAAFRGQGIDVVAGVGGGSVLDAAKAIAGLLPSGDSVLEYLEGVGRGREYRGPSTPFIAVPTTAGTGSEATKNAVLSRRGETGFKKSFRHEELVARVALVDPGLLASCPPWLIAADGMDALTQLLESYVSLGANPFTQALAFSGMAAFREGFWPAWENREEQAIEGRARLAYASLLSGICLAQTGLGSVHGLASPLGAFFPAPHGVVCGTLVAEATELNIRALGEREPGHPALAGYAEVGRLLSEQSEADEATARGLLVEVLRAWTARLALPGLGHYGMSEEDIPRVVANSRGSSMKTNPLVLTDGELAELLRRRL